MRREDTGDAERHILELRLNDAMRAIYERAGRELGYWASYYLRMLRALGGLATARRLLHAKATSEGYARLRDAGRLDLTVEACVLQPEFEPLFTAEELNLAHDRLARYGFQLSDTSGSREELLAPTLASILRASRRPDISVALPESRAVVSIQTMLRQEKCSGQPIPKVEHCWAPNKIAVDFDEGSTWPELVLVHLLERAGWEARWVKYWGTGREFCCDVGDPKSLTGRGAEGFESIHAHAPSLRGAGTWDVLAWRRDELLFLESKQHGSSDRLRDTQLTFLEAGLDIGIGIESFAVVEYQSGKGTSPATPHGGRPVISPPRAKIATPPDPDLLHLVESAANAPADVRIELYRDRIAAYGSPAIALMEAWVDAGRSPGFASMVIEAVGKTTDPSGAVRSLRRIRGLLPDLASIIDPAIARVEATRRPVPSSTDRRPSGDVYTATGTPPPDQGPCGIRNRDGSDCHNPGRHRVGDTWSCTTHYRAATRRGLVQP